MRKIITVFGAVIALVMTASTAYAATLKNIRGDVKVNTGTGFHSVTNSASVQTGDKILLGLDGTANIVYANGVSVSLKSGLATVKSPFAKPMTVGEAAAAIGAGGAPAGATGAATAGAAGTGAAGAAAAGAGAAAAGTGVAGVAAGLGISTTALAVGAGVAAAAVAVGATVVANANKNDEPLSP